MKRSSLVVLFLTLAGCGGTERTRIQYPVTVQGSRAPIVTDSGWTVTLTEGTARFNALRFFEGKVLLSQAPRWWEGLLVGSAWAHPGHYIPGEALGELVAPVEVDLRAASPVSWGTADGVTAEYGSAELTWASGGLTVAGTATKGGTTVEFSAQFTPPKPLQGLRFDAVMTASPGTVHLVIDEAVLLSRIDFASVGSSAKPLDLSSPAYNGLGRGVEDTSAYVLTQE